MYSNLGKEAWAVSLTDVTVTAYVTIQGCDEDLAQAYASTEYCSNFFHFLQYPLSPGSIVSCPLQSAKAFPHLFPLLSHAKATFFQVFRKRERGTVKPLFSVAIVYTIPNCIQSVNCIQYLNFSLKYDLRNS